VPFSTLCSRAPVSLLLQHGSPARQLLASTPTFDRDLEDRSELVFNPLLESAYKIFEVSAATSAASCCRSKRLAMCSAQPGLILNNDLLPCRVQRAVQVCQTSICLYG
jgi:hypothetical protein